MANNSPASVLFVCTRARCGMKYMGIATAVGRRCICGAPLVLAKPKEPVK